MCYKCMLYVVSVLSAYYVLYLVMELLEKSVFD